MAANLYQRAAARGFPVYNRAGQTGQGALPDSTLSGAAGPGVPAGTWTDPNQDPGSVPAAMPAPQEWTTGGLWGLSGSPSPDPTPRTHAAPMADPTLPVGEYFAEADATHSDEFGAAQRFTRPAATLDTMALDHVTASGGSGSDQQPLYKQPISALGGLDAVQGFGGGADGPGGVNASMPLLTDTRDYPGSFYAADGFVSAAEVPFLTPEADQFIPNAPELGPWLGGNLNAPTTSVLAQDITTGDTPAQGPAVSQSAGVPAYATSFWM